MGLQAKLFVLLGIARTAAGQAAATSTEGGYKFACGPMMNGPDDMTWHNGPDPSIRRRAATTTAAATTAAATTAAATTTVTTAATTAAATTAAATTAAATTATATAAATTGAAANVTSSTTAVASSGNTSASTTSTANGTNGSRRLEAITARRLTANGTNDTTSTNASGTAAATTAAPTNTSVSTTAAAAATTAGATTAAATTASATTASATTASATTASATTAGATTAAATTAAATTPAGTTVAPIPTTPCSLPASVVEKPMFCYTSGAQTTLVPRLQSYVTCCKIRTWREPDGSTWEECAERAADAQCAGSTVTRDQLNSSCTAATLVTVQVTVVTVSMDLPDAIKFAELMANPTVMEALKSNVAASFASAAGIPVGYVTVTFAEKTSRRLDARKSSLRRLVAGGVAANAQILAPAGSSVAAVQSAISSTGNATLAEGIVDAVLTTPGIENAAPGQTLTQLQNARLSMISTVAASYAAPTTASVTMTLDSSSPLATAAQSNTWTTTTTTAATTTVVGTTTSAANVTTTLPSEGVTSDSRALAATTITAAAVLIAVLA